MLPDANVLVITYLYQRDDVVALTDRIGTRAPKNLDTPWVRITLLDDQPATRSQALHLTTALLQLDCYGGADRDAAQREASLIGRTLREAIVAMPGVEHQGAVVTRARAGSLRSVPDPSMDPARERYILDAEITFHPAPAA